MKNSEIYNIKDKNSQEILLYLQKKDFEKNKKYLDSDYRKILSNKIYVEENNEENLPKTRMNQFLNTSFFTYEGKKSPSKSISYETKEQTPIISTPKFIKDIAQFPININFNIDNSQFSFSNGNNINDNNVDNDKNNDMDISSLNYLDFHLQENSNKSSKNSSLNNDNHYHVYLPKKYKDDEKYKARLYKYLKCEREKNYSHSYILPGIKTKNISPKRKLPKMQKIKKLFSVKKKDINKIIFFGDKGEKRFNFYKDENIGIGKNWQLSNLYKDFDNDVESDEEQIEKGKNKMLNDLKIGIVRWSQNKNNCFNYKLLKSPVEIESVKRVSMSA